MAIDTQPVHPGAAQSISCPRNLQRLRPRSTFFAKLTLTSSEGRLKKSHPIESHIFKSPSVAKVQRQEVERLRVKSSIATEHVVERCRHFQGQGHRQCLTQVLNRVYPMTSGQWTGAALREVKTTVACRQCKQGTGPLTVCITI